MEQMICSGLLDMGLEGRFDPSAPRQLAEYGRLLLKQNQVMNLTAIRDEERVARLHMLDSAALLYMADFRGKSLLDVGTGAGFPGLALKILVPSLEVTLLDSLEKRLLWLNEVIAALHLTGATTLHVRAEEQALEYGFRDCFDFVAARAVTQMNALTELCLPYVKPGGLFLAMKSAHSDGELEGAARAIELLGGQAEETREYTIPGTQVTHRILSVRKMKVTPAGYPRRWAKIQKQPL